MKKSLWILALALAPALAQADTKADVAKIEADLTKCMDTADSNMAMKECQGNAYTSMDRILNRDYQAITVRLRRDASSGDEYTRRDAREIQNRLLAAQRAWITYRDANCSLAGIEMLGGSGESLVVSGCYYGATKDRVLELDRLLGESATR